jgi:hypothetical protein
MPGARNNLLWGMEPLEEGSDSEPGEDGTADTLESPDVGPAEGNYMRESSGLGGTEYGVGGAGCVEAGDGSTLDLLVPDVGVGSTSDGAGHVGAVDRPRDLLAPDTGAGSTSDLLPATEAEGDTVVEILCG